MNQRHKGQVAEKIAQNYLKQLGYKILETNYYSNQKKEIDIIAMDGKELVIVEVKSGSYFSPATKVNFSKRKRILQATESFLYKKRLSPTKTRFEILSITMPEKKINHFTEEFFDI